MATIKQDIKATHRADNALTDREYSYMASNMSLWSAPAAELDHGFYEQRRESLEPMLDILGIKDLGEDAIRAVIKQRNNMAHGGMATRTNTTSEEIIALMGGGGIQLDTLKMRLLRRSHKQALRVGFTDGLEDSPTKASHQAEAVI